MAVFRACLALSFARPLIPSDPLRWPVHLLGDQVKLPHLAVQNKHKFGLVGDPCDGQKEQDQVPPAPDIKTSPPPNLLPANTKDMWGWCPITSPTLCYHTFVYLATPLIALAQPSRPVVGSSSSLTPVPMTSIHPSPLPDDQQQCWVVATDGKAPRPRIGRASCWLSTLTGCWQTQKDCTLLHCAPFLALVAAQITLYWQPISPFLTASLDCWKLGCMFRWWIPAMISKLTVHTQATKNTPAGEKNNVKSSFLPNQSISEWVSRGNNQYGYSEFLLASRHSHLRIC